MALLCRLIKLPGRSTQNSGSHSHGAKDRVGDSTISHQGPGCSLGAQSSPNQALLPFPSHLVAHSLPCFPGTPLFPQIPCIAPLTPPARAPLSQWLCQSRSWSLVPSSSSPYGVTSRGQCAVQCPMHPRQQLKGASPPCSVLNPSQHLAGPRQFRQQPKPLCCSGEQAPASAFAGKLCVSKQVIVEAAVGWKPGTSPATAAPMASTFADCHTSGRKRCSDGARETAPASSAALPKPSDSVPPHWVRAVA